MVEKMISNLVKNAPRIPEWILTSIKDPSSKLKRKTSNVEVLKRGVKYLRFGGGGDPKEAILKGGDYRECLTESVSNQKLLQSITECINCIIIIRYLIFNGASYIDSSSRLPDP